MLFNKQIKSIENCSNDFIFFCHLLLGFIFFSNYFLFQQIFIYSTDVLNINLPLLLTAKRNFLSGHLGLWNPYLLSGTTVFASSNQPILSPDNWPHFLVPEKYFFAAATFYSFIKFWLIGVFAYLAFFEELQSRKWAFFSSVVYQFCGYTIWALLVYDVLSMVLFTTISFYIVWTLHRRSACRNYVYLTIALALNLFSSNLAYTAHSMIVISVVFLYRYFSQAEFRPIHFFCFAAAAATSVCISLMRLLPVWMETHSSNRSFGFAAQFIDTSFLALRLFDPEALGVSYKSSIPIISAITPLADGMHIQWAMPHYFGVISALLVVWAIVSPQRGKINFWIFYTIVVLSLIVFIEPFDTVFRLLHPAYHTLSLQIFLPVGFSLLAGHAAKSLEENYCDFRLNEKPAQVFIFAIIAIALYILAVWAVNFVEILGSIRLWLLSFLSAGALMAFICRVRPRARSVIISVIICVALASLVYGIIFSDHGNKTYLSHIKNISASLVLLVLTYGCLLIAAFKKSGLSSLLMFTVIVLFLICLSVILYPWEESVSEPVELKRQSFFMAMLGFFRFAVIAAIFITTLFLLSLKRFDPSFLFPFFLSILLFEQVPAGKVHSHLVLNPFYDASTPYPPIQEKYLDLSMQPIKNLDYKNYRVNRPNTMLRLPLYAELNWSYNEILSSIFSIYEIRSYGGHYNVVSSRYGRFINGVAPNLPIGEVGYGVYIRIDDERFLDLLGVAYDFKGYDSYNDSKIVKTRPTALSRFMLFKNFEVINAEEKELDRLRDRDFDPLGKVVLEKDPGFAARAHSGKVLQYTEISPDEIEVEVSSDSPAILFFGDSYHSDWRAYRNGMEQPIIPANHNFMSTAVPAGLSKIVFRFLPRYFIYGVYTAIGGCVLFVLVTLVLHIKFRKLKGVHNGNPHFRL